MGATPADLAASYALAETWGNGDDMRRWAKRLAALGCDERGNPVGDQPGPAPAPTPTPKP
jgi:hypothetical protein